MNQIRKSFINVLEAEGTKLSLIYSTVINGIHAPEPLPEFRKQSGVPSVDHAAWGGIHGLVYRASRMASMGRRLWLRALIR